MMPGNVQETVLQRKCPYCHSNHTGWDKQSKWGSKAKYETRTKGADRLIINLSHLTLVTGYILSEFKIKYCPFCGRYLGVDNGN